MEDDELPRTPRYLQKKNAYTGSSYHDPVRLEPSTLEGSADQRASDGLGRNNKARKGSLRYAMRRIFGRRSREPEPPPMRISPPRHDHHNSETTGFTAPNESRSVRTRDENQSLRVRSTPVPTVAASDIQRARSPYAMQFPQSSRLKPLDLSNSFALSGGQLRRSRTLPRVQFQDYRVPDRSLESPTSQGHGSVGSRDLSTALFDSPASKGKREKRRSRSADDLTRYELEAVEPSTSRNEEMRQWQQSFQGSVLRASGFTTRESNVDMYDRPGQDTTSGLADDRPLDNTGVKVTPAYQRDTSDRGFGSTTAFDADISRDLEDRVARLETGLQIFRGQLTQLSNDRNRRTVLVGGSPTQSRATRGGRTASMLATDLQQENWSDKQYDDVARTSLPQSPARNEGYVATSAFAQPTEDPFVSPPRIQPISDTSSRNTTPQYTFRSLYEMLADERSARRRLETQMMDLRQELTNLHYQVSYQSNAQSQRSSYYAPMDPMRGSSRLHALLQDTDPSPPTTAQPQRQPVPQLFSTGNVGLFSRFSASESEIGGGMETEDQARTPRDAYLTPLESARFDFGDQFRNGAGVF